MKFVALSKRWLRQVIEANPTWTVPLTGGIKVPLGIGNIPVPSRVGLNPDDKSAFYESSAKRLFAYYYAYASNVEAKYSVLYTEIIALKHGNLTPIDDRYFNESDITVTFEAIPYTVPISLRRHASRAVDFFQKTGRINKNDSGEWENNVAVSIRKVSADGHIICRKARYFDQVGTNITLDWASGSLGALGADETIRSTVERPINGLLPVFENSCLANTIGTAVVVFNKDREPIIRTRSDQLAAITKK